MNSGKRTFDSQVGAERFMPEAEVIVAKTSSGGTERT